MGLDAFVRCRCFEEGKCKPAPVPHDDLFVVKEEGYINSKTYAKACEELGWSEADRLYGELEQAMFEWHKNACEHEDMEYASEHIGNWGGMGRLYGCLKDAGEEKFPLLLEMASAGNGGFFPVEKAKDALGEIAELEKVVEDLHEYSLYTVRQDDWTGYSDEQNWHVIPHSSIGEPVAAEFVVKKEDNVKEFISWKLDILKRLLNASLETGNPINWC